MALLIPGSTRCPLCEAVIGAGDDIVATSHFIGDPSDPLWKFSDAAMHRPCFLRWPDREPFIARYHETLGAITSGDGTYLDMQPDGTIVRKQEINRMARSDALEKNDGAET
jgi:hypothetical protein